LTDLNGIGVLGDGVLEELNLGRNMLSALPQEVLLNICNANHSNIFFIV
jgi:hypothetical protein